MRTSYSHSIRLTLAALAVAALSAPAGAANLLANGEFSDFTVLPWYASQGKVYLSNLDHANNSNSGSALIVDDNATFIATSLLYDCIQIQAGSQADLSAYLKAGTKVPANSKVRIGRFYYSDTACSGSSYISGANSGFVAVPGSWALITHAGVAPAGTQSVRVEIVANSGDTSELDVYVDGVVLAGSEVSPPGTVHSDGFESGNFGSWTVVQ